ncbi:MAG: ABC transporter ATP-binding protein [Bacillota bacterium]|nr:ABC transporter ATP-binding protein [Bacillota bacterium]
MHKYFINKYAMTELGAKNLKKSIISHVFVNLSKIFPAIVGFAFIFQFLGGEFGIDTGFQLSFLQYVVVIATMILVMFFTARWDYICLYENVYQESARTRVAIANRLKKLPLSYFGRRDLSDLSATIMSDVELYETIFSHSVPQFYATVISTIIISVLILINNWKLGVAALWVIPLSFLVFRLSKGRQDKVFRETLENTRKVYDDVQEKMDLIQEIKANHLEEKASAELYEKVEKLGVSKIKTEFAASMGIGFSTIVLKLGLVSVAVVGANMVIQGEVGILMYIAYLMLSASIYVPIESLIGMLTMILIMDKVVIRMREIQTMPIQEGKEEMHVENYDIEFKDVHFGYEDIPVINGVSFTAKQGEVTALIGSSGSGKTTLAKLAARFWDIDRGQILLGGEDISKVDPETLLQHFAIVFQDVVLFNASIRDNIKIGKKGASDEEILNAARIARCDEFYSRLPQGIDTVIGENGERLSGGERQRISIARAILKDAPIILMDEATASLDVENESLIQAALSELTRDKTVVVIAHRMRTVRGADKIVVLENGRVESEGRHEDLLEKSQVYRRMLQKSGADLS